MTSRYCSVQVAYDKTISALYGFEKGLVILTINIIERYFKIIYKRKKKDQLKPKVYLTSC